VEEELVETYGGVEQLLEKVNIPAIQIFLFS
jgi:hypothetical protein